MKKKEKSRLPTSGFKIPTALEAAPRLFYSSALLHRHAVTHRPNPAPSRSQLIPIGWQQLLRTAQMLHVQQGEEKRGRVPPGPTPLPSRHTWPNL